MPDSVYLARQVCQHVFIVGIVVASQKEGFEFKAVKDPLCLEFARSVSDLCRVHPASFSLIAEMVQDPIQNKVDRSRAF